MGDASRIRRQDGKPAAEPKASSPIIKWLIWIAAGDTWCYSRSGYIYICGTKQQQVYTNSKNIALVKAPPPLETFNFIDEFRINTADIGKLILSS